MVVKPVIGVCLWLIEGKDMSDTIDWCVKNGFGGISLSQVFMAREKAERVGAAKALAFSGLNLTYHGGVSHKVTTSGMLDRGFVKDVIEDVLFWHENAGGIKSFCFDPVKVPGKGSEFILEINKKYAVMLSETFKKKGIQLGVENVFNSALEFSSLEVISDFKTECKDLGLGMLFDAAHANIHVRSDAIKGENEIGAYFEALPYEVLEIHLSDNKGVKDEHRGLGNGNLDLSALVKAAKKKGFKGQFSVEVCKDILKGQYGMNIHDLEEISPVLKSRDKLLEAMKENW